MSMQSKSDVFSFARQSVRILRGAYALSFVFLLIITSPVQAEVPCSGATPMDLDSSLRSHVDASELLVEIYVPSSGILSINAAVPSTAAEDAQIGAVGLACLPWTARAPIVIERSVSHQVVNVSVAGTYVFRVTSQDHWLLGEIKVSSAFVADADTGGVPNRYGENEEEIEIDGLALPPSSYGENEEEIEIDGFAPPPSRYGENEEEIEIDGFGAPPSRYGENEEEIEIDGFAPPPSRYGENEEEIEIDGFGAPPSSYGENEEEIEIDGFGMPNSSYGENEEEIEIDGFGVPPSSYGENEEEIEIDGFGVPPSSYGENEEEIEIDGLVAPGSSRSLVEMLSQLCRQSKVDDHGDSFTCATFLVPDRWIAGEIGNSAGDDVDIFHFVVGNSSEGDSWAVSIEAPGDVVGGVYDRSGRRLTVSDDSRLVSSLRPGAYYVRVEGRNAGEGPYRLRVNASP